jgi:rubrerythrin
MSDNQVCYTFDAAVEMAIQMENEGFRHYKHQLEKALLDGRMDGGDALDQPVPTMHLDYVFKKQELGPNSGVREALLFAIHLEKGAVDFYGTVSSGCEGAPMGKLFQQLLKEETRHLQSLEDLYEQHFMTEN